VGSLVSHNKEKTKTVFENGTARRMLEPNGKEETGSCKTRSFIIHIVRTVRLAGHTARTVFPGRHKNL
jgi:hypothetical protein